MGAKTLIGSDIIRLDAVGSTNEKAKEHLGEGIPEGTVVVAGRQAAGRGRYGRAWASPPGGLYLSIVLKPAERDVHLLSLLSGLPVVKAIGDAGATARLKWPNDVLLGGRKVGGILCEGIYRHEEYFAVVGIGINTSSDIKRLPSDIADSATTLRREVGKEIDNDSFLSVLLRRYDEFYREYKAQHKEMLLAEYRQLCSTLGMDVAVDTAKGTVRGTARDISSTGALVVETRAGMVEVYEGTVKTAGGRA